MASDVAVAEALGALAEEYGERVRVTDARCELWLALMADIEDRELMRSVVLYLREANPHPPSPGQLIQLAKESTGATPTDETLEADASKEWETAHKFIRGDWCPKGITRWTKDELEEAFSREHPRAAAVLRRLGKPSDLGLIEAGKAASVLRPGFVRTYKAMARDAHQKRERKALGEPERLLLD